MMREILQRVLLLLGVIALVGLVADIVLSILLTMPASVPVHVVTTQAGPYLLTVGFSHDPAEAGYALPFTITSQQPLTYEVNTLPGQGVDATPIRATMGAGAGPNEMQGTAEITVRGSWLMHIVADGPQGRGEATVPIQAVAPPPLPAWMGWLIGGVLPIGGFLLFLLLHRPHRQQQSIPATL